jgi:hypothetical protein
LLRSFGLEHGNRVLRPGEGARRVLDRMLPRVHGAERHAFATL